MTKRGMVYHIYCDESRQTQDRFMLLGGLILLASDENDMAERFRSFRQEREMYAELKWTKVSGQKLTEYQAFVDIFFDVWEQGRTHFHAMALDTQKINHRKYNKGDAELGFYKFYYQLLLRRFGDWYYDNKEEQRFIVYLDYRTTKYKLGALQLILNRGMQKEYKARTKPFVSIEPLDSHHSEMIQLTDVLMGAIGFQKNGYHLRTETKEAKKLLAAYIAERAGLPNLQDGTGNEPHGFSLWDFRLRT